MIDLSFLTEEEQGVIMAVLKRDAKLKRAEEHRVHKLQQTVDDKVRLRNLTGEWFYETKQLRHQDRIHGSDIIMASIRHTHKPLTILELSQVMLHEPSSFVSSENKEVFVPPVLCGLLHQPPTQLYHNQSDFEPHDACKADVHSPTKRKNPFNTEFSAFDEQNHLADREIGEIQAQKGEPLPLSDSSVYHNNIRREPDPVVQDPSAPIVIPETSRSQDGLVVIDGLEGRQTDSATPRGILKILDTSPSPESSLSEPEPQDPVCVDSPTEAWIDRKQVRFSSVVGQDRVEWQNGKELGEHSLLDVDSNSPSEAEGAAVNNCEKTTGDTSDTRRPTLHQIGVDLQENEVGCRSETSLLEQDVGQHQDDEHCPAELLSPTVSSPVSAEQAPSEPADPGVEPEEELHSQDSLSPNRPNIHRLNLHEQSPVVSVEAATDPLPPKTPHSHAVSPKPKPRQKIFEIFRRQKERMDEEPSLRKEEEKMEETKPGNSLDLCLGATDTTEDNPKNVGQEAKPLERSEVRTIQLAAMQNTSFKDTGIADSPQDGGEDDAVPFSHKLSNLKAFWERGNTAPKILFCKDKMQKEISASGSSLCPQPCVESFNNLLAEAGPTADKIAGRSQDQISTPQTEKSLIIYLLDEDETYRADPVLICEETDDSLTGSMSEVQENASGPVNSSVNVRKQQEDEPLSISIQQEEKPYKTTELFFKSEFTKASVNAASANDATSCSVGARMVSFQTDLKTSLNKESETEQKSPSKNKAGSKSLKATDKGFVSQSLDRFLPKSTSDQQVNADAGCQDRPRSPCKSPKPRSKDQDEDVRLSPSKTLHPRVLPRESSSPTRSKLEGSPLKTFPIDINPQSVEEQLEKLSPVRRQTRSPAHGARQTTLSETKPSPANASCPADREIYRDEPRIQPSRSSPSKATPLARSVVPQDYQHYLGPQKMAHVPPFYQEDDVAGESDAVLRPQTSLRSTVGNNPPRSNSLIVQNKEANSSQDASARAWSLSRASSGSHNESPIMSALKRFSSRMSSSKSLENLATQPRGEGTEQDSREQLNLSVDDVSSASTLPSSKQMKSVSVPLLQQDETDSDSTFETHLGLRRDTGSSTSNISLSSGMASMSSQVSGSTSSIFPTDFGEVEVKGNIQFAVNYIQKLEEFHIFVVHCRELAVAETKKHRSDPYVKCYLLPDVTKLGKRKTSVKKKTLNPDYNEILRFKIAMEVLTTQNLNVSVWHNDTFGRNSFLGEVELDLSEWNFSNTQINEYTLKARVSAQSSNPSSPVHQKDSRGRMRVALRFLPQTSHSKRTSAMETGEVQIWVKDCKNLPPIRGVIIDPFVKCTVLPDISRKSRQKTRVVKRTANPLFNHTMVYDGFRAEDLKEACVEISVWDHDRLNNHYIGGLRLGLGTGKSYGMEVFWMDSTLAEATLWQRMLEADGEWVEGILPLRIFVLAKSMSK